MATPPRRVRSLDRVRRALAEGGARLAAARNGVDAETERLGVLVASAAGAGLTVSRIAELTGLTRQKVYELRDRYAATDVDLEERALAQVASGGATSRPSLAQALQQDADVVDALVERLLTEGSLQTVVTHYRGGEPEGWVQITRAGERQLEEWFEGDAARPARMAVYTAMDPDERKRLVAAATEVFGAEWFAVVEPGTVHAQTWPELAFHVIAHDPGEAVVRGRERLAELRELAELPPGPAVVTAVAPADPWHATFGTS
jgi:hypothetical protein